MNILIFNWRDIKNPLSGGAEVLTHEMAEHWVKKGNSVTLFTSYFPGARNKEVINGVNILREGAPDLRSMFNSVHFKAFLYYRRVAKGNFDVIVDEIHGMPFFTPMYIKEPIVPLICEVAKDIWDKMFPFPWNIIGKTLERLSLWLYRKKHFLTISDSTKLDLVSYGIAAKNITVLTMGFNRVQVGKIHKERIPTLIFVARLNKMKGVEDAITAISLLKKTYKSIRLWIVGRGEESYIEHLRTLVIEFGLEEQITFWNFIPEKKKYELMAKAHAIVVPSLREGFGLIVPEAGSVGTPAVVYDSHGLRDIIKNGVNGYKVKKNPLALSKGVSKLIGNKSVYRKLSAGAQKESEKYTWERTGAESIRILQNIQK